MTSMDTTSDESVAAHWPEMWAQIQDLRDSGESAAIEIYLLQSLKESPKGIGLIAGMPSSTASQLHATPVSYTHLTLPTILLV